MKRALGAFSRGSALVNAYSARPAAKPYLVEHANQELTQAGLGTPESETPSFGAREPGEGRRVGILKALASEFMSNGLKTGGALNPSASEFLPNQPCICSIPNLLMPLEVCGKSSANSFEDIKWWYIDEARNVQGPFLSEEMRAWFKAGYFPQNLLVWCDGMKHEYRPLSILFPDTRLAFATAPNMAWTTPKSSAPRTGSLLLGPVLPTPAPGSHPPPPAGLQREITFSDRSFFESEPGSSESQPQGLQREISFEEGNETHFDTQTPQIQPPPGLEKEMTTLHPVSREVHDEAGELNKAVADAMETCIGRSPPDTPEFGSQMRPPPGLEEDMTPPGLQITLPTQTVSCQRNQISKKRNKLKNMSLPR